MKQAVVCLFLFAALYGAHASNPYGSSLSKAQVDVLFSKWMRQHGVSYASHAERDHRLHIFRDNLEYVMAHNADPAQTSLLKMNRFGDLTNAEFRQRQPHSNKIQPASREKQSSKANQSLLRDLPDSVDWTAEGKVLPVTDQGQCGSSGAFVATDVLASAYAIEYNTTPVELSIQELNDCDSSSGGCSGSGVPGDFYSWIISNGGICTAASYTGANGTCASTSCNNFVTLTGTFTVPANDSTALAEAVAAGPVASLVQASSSAWQFYSSGVITDPSCGTTPDHAVVITGYGVTSGTAPQEYWIVKNSWGASWGMNGYVWVAKDDSASAPGECGIATFNQYPSGVSKA